MRKLRQRIPKFTVCILLIFVWLTSSGGGGCGGSGGSGGPSSSGPGIVDPFSFDLIINKTGTGTGKVTLIDNTILCGQSSPECRINYSESVILELKAIPSPNSDFIGWNGECSGKGTCVVVLDYYKYVVARFRLRH